MPKRPHIVTPAEYKADVTALFDSVAEYYDRIGPAFFSAIGRALAERVGITAGAAVADIACGRGATLIPAAEHAAGSGRVIGVDISDGMITELRVQLDQAGLTNIGLCLMDAEKLAFPDAAFDSVLCSMSLPFFPQPEQALAEMHRVLKPGGKVGVSVFHSDTQWWSFISRIAAPYGVEMTAPRWPWVKGFVRGLDEPEILASVLMRTGFGDVHTGYFETEAIYKDEQEWWRSLSSHGARQLLEMMTPDVRRRFQADAFEALRELKTASGISLTVAANLCTGRSVQNLQRY